MGTAVIARAARTPAGKACRSALNGTPARQPDGRAGHGLRGAVDAVPGVAGFEVL